MYFAPFRADIRTGTLWRGDSPVVLTRKAFALLRCLIERAGRVVSRETLLETVWPDTHVHPDNIKVLVAEIRRALGDDAESPTYVRTAPKRGYVFVAPVVEAPRELTRPGPPAPFVGRQSELEALGAALDEAAAGDRRLFFVTGPSGIGKTSLVEAFLASATTARAIRLAWAHCRDQQDAPEPYSCLMDLLRRLLQGADREAVSECLTRHAPSWMPHLQPPAASAAPRCPRHSEPGSMVREIVLALETMASDLPLVLWLDDLQWADPATIDVIASLGLRSERAKLLVVGAMHSLEGERGTSALRQVPADLVTRRQGAVLELSPLSELDVKQYLRLRFGTGHLGETAPVIHRATGGNPLFLITSLDYLVATGRVAPGSDGWQATVPLDGIDALIPESLAGAVGRQIDTLARMERRALEHASVVGVETSLWALAAASGVDELVVEPIVRALDHRGMLLARAGTTISPEGVPTPIYRFRHAVYRELTLRGMDAAARAAAHRRVGCALERAFAGREQEVAADLACHFLGAGDRGKVGGYLRLAARNALLRSAPREAAVLLHGAEAHAAYLTGAAAVDLELAICLERGEAQLGAGDRLGAVATFTRMERLASRTSRPEQRLRAQVALAHASLGVSRTDCLVWARTARTMAGATPDAALAASATIQTGLLELYFEGWSDALADACLEAWRQLPPDGGGEQRSAAIRLLFIHQLRSRYSVALNSGRGLLADALRESALPDCLYAYHSITVAALHLGRLADATKFAAEGAALASRTGSVLGAATMRLQQAWIAVESHRWDDALGLSLADRARLEDSGWANGLQMSRLYAGAAYLGLGRLDEAERELNELRDWYGRERVVMDWFWRIQLHLALADLALKRKDLEAARREADAARAAAGATPERTWRSRAHTMACQVALAAGDVDAAQRALRHALHEIGGTDAALARWRAEAARASLLERQTRTESARRAQRRSDRILELLQHSRYMHEPGARGPEPRAAASTDGHVVPVLDARAHGSATLEPCSPRDLSPGFRGDGSPPS